MDDHNILEERQVIYIEEDAVVLDGKEIQYVIPQAIAKSGGNMLIQEDGTSFTHYLLDSDNVSTVENASETIIQQVDYASHNDLINNSIEEDNEILQYTQDQDVVAQVVLNEEQCRILQDFGRVLITQGSRKFLLDAEGLKEVDSSFDNQNIIYTSGNDTCDEISNNVKNELSTQQDNEIHVSSASGDKHLEKCYILEDNKESEFDFIHNNRCDVIMDESHLGIETTDNAEEKTTECFFMETLPDIVNNVEGDINKNNQNERLCDSSNVKCKQMDINNIYNISSTSKLISNNEINKFQKNSHKNRNNTLNIKQKQSQKESMLSGKGKSLPQIRDGKIILMPEDAHSPYAKKLIKNHFANKYLKNPVKLHVSKSQSLKTSKPNKLTLKNLKDFKIYIGSTEDGKNIYGKIIDIKPPANSKLKRSVDESSKLVKNIEIENKEIENQNKNFGTKSESDPNYTQTESLLKVKNKPGLIMQGINTSNSITATDLNKIISEKENRQKLSSSSTEMSTSLLCNSSDIQSTSKIDYNDFKYTSMPFKDDTNKADILVPSEEELETLNKIFSKMSKSPVVKRLVSRDILIIKGQENGKSEMFTGRMTFADTNETICKFIYMPELWSNVQGSTTNILKNSNFIVLKLIKNISTNTTEIVIMDKVKYPEKQDKEKMIIQVNNAKCGKKTMHCPYCKKVFYRMSCLSRHMIIHTAQQVVHKCSHCSCVFRFPSTLTRHLVEQHSGNDMKTQKPIED